MSDYRASRDRIWGIQRNGAGGFVRAVRRPTLSRSERMLLLALVEFAPNIEPSLVTLSTMMETDERTVRRLLTTLNAKGYLRVVARPGRRSFYELALPAIPVDDPPSEEEQPRASRPPSETGHPGHSARTPWASCPDTPDTMPDEADKEADKKADKLSEQGFTTTSKVAKRSPIRATKLPADWNPSEAHEEFARKHGLDLDLEVTKFKGHADDKGRVAKSWNGAFTTWLGNAVTFQRGRSNGAPKVQRGMDPGIKLGSANYLEDGE